MPRREIRNRQYGVHVGEEQIGIDWGRISIVALDHSCQVQRHSYAEREHDLYESPPCAVEALLRVERLPLHVWEPACGKSGNIVNVLRARGHGVYPSDLVDYGTDPTAHYGRDFFLEAPAPLGFDCIVTNPPF